MEIKDILIETESIAVVGCSSDKTKPANLVPAYLIENGYNIIPINPSGKEIFGKKALPSLSELKEKVDMVLVFRPSEETPLIAKETIKVGAKFLWLQDGISNEEAKEIAEKKRIVCVMNKCIMKEHMEIFG